MRTKRITYHVEKFVPVNGDAVGELDAVEALMQDLVLVRLLQRTRKHAECYSPPKSTVSIRQRPHPPPLVDALQRVPARVDLPRADAQDRGHAGPLHRRLGRDNVEPPRLLHRQPQLPDRSPAQPDDARRLAERAVAHARQHLNLVYARRPRRRQQPHLPHRRDSSSFLLLLLLLLLFIAGLRRKLLPDDVLAAARQPKNVASRGAGGERATAPGVFVRQPQHAREHLERGILDGRGDCLRRQVHLHVLVERRDDIVGPLGEREGAAGDEAQVARGRVLTSQRGGNVAGNVGGDGRGRGAGEVGR
ncbi:hypothetical protein BBAD15_g7015 [Beauveria bassiana D1-5]|uniref:Uncharacterized protein n=1 Tax=Beauveria bassiana D1-5 TaxID=1245745 RepID=A0A0A2W401_BEABA|nr:hypothetical protein BBAD15_g7015 [Beauveria bassiana D1-5]